MEGGESAQHTRQDLTLRLGLGIGLGIGLTMPSVGIDATFGSMRHKQLSCLLPPRVMMSVYPDGVGWLRARVRVRIRARVRVGRTLGEASVPF